MTRRGFTLIELMIVVAIVGILAAVAIPNVLRYRARVACRDAPDPAACVQRHLGGQRP